METADTIVNGDGRCDVPAAAAEHALEDSPT